jgi:nitroreductase
MSKTVHTGHPVHELIVARWSPYAFADRPVSASDLLSLLEAARWAPSSYNEQPWSFLVATKAQPEEFARMLSCLVDANQAWAKNAPVLVLCCTRLHFVRNGKPNAAAVHDLGLATANLMFEATARGLAVHAMIGIEPERVRTLYEVPEGVQPLTAIALGYAGDPSVLAEGLRDRDRERRPREPLAKFVFAGKWGSARPGV